MQRWKGGESGKMSKTCERWGLNVSRNKMRGKIEKRIQTYAKKIQRIRMGIIK